MSQFKEGDIVESTKAPDIEPLMEVVRVEQMGSRSMVLLRHPDTGETFKVPAWQVRKVAD